MRIPKNQTELEKYLHALEPRRLLARWVGPKVVLASVPKAGTNLLIRVLKLFPQLVSEGTAVGAPNMKPELLIKIARLKRGRFITTHYGHADIAYIVEAQDMRGVFLLRDPRDTCVSWYHYIMRQPEHWCHTYFHETLPDRTTRLMATITGLKRDPPIDCPHLNSIAEHFRLRIDYLEQPRFLTIRFEDLVGAAGGGDDTVQRKTLEQISAHLNLPLKSRDLKYIMDRAFSRKSPTFRKGQIGSWREELEPEHKVAFKALTGTLLIDLGYENDTGW